MRKTIKVVAAIIRKENSVFATQRGYGEYKDWWEFPGGKIESGETPEAALKREIKEELDSDIVVEQYLTTVEHDYPEFHLSMDRYWCRLESGKPTLLEHEAAIWLPVDDLRQVNWLPADVLVVEAIEESLLKHREGEDDLVYLFQKVHKKENPVEISKKDWKLFREYVPKWQTRYIGKLNREYIELLSSDGDAADHFWELEERIRKDKKHPGVSIEISKGDAIYDLLLLCRTGVIGMSDLEEFSDSTKDAVRQLLDLR